MGRTRTDSKGRGFYQDRKSRKGSRERPYFRRYYKGQNDRYRDFSRDMRSVSRNSSKSRNSRENNTERGRPRDRYDSKDRSKSGCRNCKCEDCEKVRQFAKELKINWCQNIIIDEEIVVNYTEKGKKVMILDLGVPVTDTGAPKSSIIT